MDASSDQVPHPGIAALVESLGTQKKPPAKSLHGRRNVIFFQTARRRAEVKRQNLKEYIYIYMKGKMSEYEWNPKKNGVKSHKIPYTNSSWLFLKKGSIVLFFQSIPPGKDRPALTSHSSWFIMAPYYHHHQSELKTVQSRVDPQIGQKGMLQWFFLFWTIPWLKHVPFDKHSDSWNIYIYTYIYMYIYIYVLYYLHIILYTILYVYINILLYIPTFKKGNTSYIFIQGLLTSSQLS